jgi:hypothetical protein
LNESTFRYGLNPLPIFNFDRPLDRILIFGGSDLNDHELENNFKVTEVDLIY